MRFQGLLSLTCTVLLLGQGPLASQSSSELSIELRGLPASVSYLEAFELELRRRWPAGHRAEAFDPKTWPQLRLRELSRVTRPDGLGDLWRYRARAIKTGRIELAAPLLRITPIQGGALRLAFGESKPLEVRSSLRPGDGPALEGLEPLPGDDAAGRPPWTWALLGLLLFLALRVLTLRLRGSPQPSQPDPVELLREMLQQGPENPTREDLIHCARALRCLLASSQPSVDPEPMQALLETCERGSYGRDLAGAELWVRQCEALLAVLPRTTQEAA